MAIYSRQKGIMKTQLEIENENGAHELRLLLLNALEALLDPDVMKKVCSFRAGNGVFKFDARMLAACAMNELRTITDERATKAEVLPLPVPDEKQKASASDTGGEKISLPPQGRIHF